jgi:hypothetical protein
VIERFEPRLIELFLRDSDLRFLVDQDGDFIVDFYGDDVPDYRVRLSAEGVDAEVLCIRIGPDICYPETVRDRIEGFVAGWNRRMRWPKAFVTEDARGRGIRVTGENSFPLGPGIHQALLDNFIAVAIGAGRQLITELTLAVDTLSSTELETWLRQAG